MKPLLLKIMKKLRRLSRDSRTHLWRLENQFTHSRSRQLILLSNSQKLRKPRPKKRKRKNQRKKKKRSD
jgi:hypothetical protein